jgi:hypothetical protein
MNRPVAAALALALPVVLVAAAFALRGQESSDSSAGPVEVTTASAPRPSHVVPASPPRAPGLEDGRHYGYIESVDLEPPTGTIAFDLAYLLTGEKANQAAAADGYETPVANDYYVVNDNPRLRTLPVSPDIEIRLVDWGRSTRLRSADSHRFQESFGLDEYPAGRYKGKFSSYWLTVEDGIVVRIEEQYQP